MLLQKWFCPHRLPEKVEGQTPTHRPLPWACRWDENHWTRQRLMEMGVLKVLAFLLSETGSITLHGDSSKICIVLCTLLRCSFQSLAICKNHKALTTETPLKINCFRIFFFLFLFFLTRKAPLPHLTWQMCCFPYFMFSVSKRQWLFRAFLHISVSEDIRYTENP